MNTTPKVTKSTKHTRSATPGRVSKVIPPNLNPAFDIESLGIVENKTDDTNQFPSPNRPISTTPKVQKTPIAKPRVQKTSDILGKLDNDVAKEQHMFKKEFGLTEEIQEEPELNDLGMEDDDQEMWEEGGIPLESYDFADDQQPTNTPDGVITAMTKHFGNSGFQHRKIFGKSDGTPFEYPQTSDRRCPGSGCGRKIKAIPVLIPVRYDEKTSSIWFFDPTHHCSLSCAVDTICSRRKSFASQCMGLLCRFAREYFGYTHQKITHIPITCVEGFCSDPSMTYEEYKNSIGIIRAVIKQCNCLFIETFVEIEDVSIRESAKEEQKKRDLEKMINTKPTEQNGKRFENMMAKIVGENKNKPSSPVFEPKQNKPKHNTWN